MDESPDHKVSAKRFRLNMIFVQKSIDNNMTKTMRFVLFGYSKCKYNEITFAQRIILRSQ